MEILPSPSLKSSRNTKYHSKNLPQPQLSLYNEAIENNVRFVQGANAFIVLFGLYEILKSTYLTSVNSQTQDSAWSQYLPLLGLNILWIFVALMGIVAINSGSKSRVINSIISWYWVVSQEASFVYIQIPNLEMKTTFKEHFILSKPFLKLLSI